MALETLLEKLKIMLDKQELATSFTNDSDSLLAISHWRSLFTSSSDSIDNQSETTLYDLNKHWPPELSELFAPPRNILRDVMVILLYIAVVVLSFFGNTLVCHVIFRCHRLRTTTNIFIINLAVSDLLMTFLNIPFNVARILLDDWPFGSLLCALVPFVQVTCVYVSTFTMTFIAADRYQVIMNPLNARLRSFPKLFIIGSVWVLAGILSIPHAIFNEVVEVFTYKRLIRCQTRYPSPAPEFRKWMTLFTFVTQYVLPLSITGFAYGRIVRRVWAREMLGAVTAQQIVIQDKAKRKTIKMLLLVVIVFAIDWLPLNLYHLITDFNIRESPSKHNSTVFLACHFLAMSSVCCNPFIYFWLNEHFRSGAKSWCRCCFRSGPGFRGDFEAPSFEQADKRGVMMQIRCHHFSEHMVQATTECDVISNTSPLGLKINIGTSLADNNKTKQQETTKFCRPPNKGMMCSIKTWASSTDVRLKVDTHESTVRVQSWEL